MPERLAVSLAFIGEPFDRNAVLHVVRHLSMQAGWTISSQADHRLIYATVDDPSTISTSPKDLVILSSAAVRDHLNNKKEPIPLFKIDPRTAFPFRHNEADKCNQRGWIPYDVIAGAYAVLNLWFERRNLSPLQDGWIKYQEDWWPLSGFADPFPIVDQLLEYIQEIANQLGWPRTSVQESGGFLENPFTLLLTHDIDYLPTQFDKGFPRLIRAVARHAIARRRLMDAFRVTGAYVNAVFSKTPYHDLTTIMNMEGSRESRSSFQIVSARRHRVDPAYELTDPAIREDLLTLHAAGWELCLHGSYLSSRSPGQIAAERKILEEAFSVQIRGHRHHYLNFHPSQLFSEVEAAGLQYDLSVGYNDRSGPRAGTLYPYKPYDIENGRPHSIWEIPFIFMDTTLATTYRLQSNQILEHIQSHLPTRRACAAIIWHQEQAGGLLDPGYDQAYVQIMDWARKQSAQLTNPGSVLDDLETAWRATLRDEVSG